MTEHERTELAKLLDKIEAVSAISKANFPGFTNIKIEATGNRCHGFVTVSPHILSMLASLGRAALKDGESHE